MLSVRSRNAPSRQGACAARCCELTSTRNAALTLRRSKASLRIQVPLRHNSSLCGREQRQSCVCGCGLFAACIARLAANVPQNRLRIVRITAACRRSGGRRHEAMPAAEAPASAARGAGSTRSRCALAMLRGAGVLNRRGDPGHNHAQSTQSCGAAVVHLHGRVADRALVLAGASR